jgi:peptide/nickel transport system permease protein
MTDPSAPAAVSSSRPSSLWRNVWTQFRAHRGAFWGALFLVFITLFVLVGPLVWDVDPQKLDMRGKNMRPIYTVLWDADAKVSWARPLGTDNLGRGTLAKMMAGGQVSLAVGWTAMILSLVLGTIIGVLAGYFRRLDGPLMRFTDLVLSLPLLPLLLVMMLLFRDPLRMAFGPETGIFILIVVVIGITSWMNTARIVRGDVLALKEQEFILAARSIGTPADPAPHPAQRAVADHGLGNTRSGQRDHHRKRPELPRPRIPVRLPDLGQASVRFGRPHDLVPRAGDLARHRNLVHRAQRQLYRRRAQGRA